MRPAKNTTFNYIGWLNFNLIFINPSKYVFTIQNRPFTWKKWKDDIIDRNGHFLSANEITEKFGIQTNFLEILQIRQSLPYAWRQTLENSSEISQINEPFLLIGKDFYTVSKATSKLAYSFYCSLIYKTPTSIGRWVEIFPGYDTEEQKTTFRRSFTITKETKLQSLQYQILHRNINCKKKLHEMRILDSPNCQHCGMTDTLIHFFSECNYVALFWQNLQNWLSTIYNERGPLVFSPKTIIFGFEGNSDYSKVINYITLLSKYFIYVKRLKNDFTLDMRAFLSFLRYKLTIEKNIALRNKTSHFDKFTRIHQSLIWCSSLV